MLLHHFRILPLRRLGLASSTALFLAVQAHAGVEVRHNRNDGDHRNDDDGCLGSGYALHNRRVQAQVGHQRNIKDLGIQELLDQVRLKDVVRGVGVILNGHRVTTGMSNATGYRNGAVEGPQHVEQTNEHWNLHEDRQAAGHRANAGLLVDLLHFLRGLGLVIAVLRADFLHLRLDFLHLARGTNLADGRLDH